MGLIIWKAKREDAVILYKIDSMRVRVRVWSVVAKKKKKMRMLY